MRHSLYKHRDYYNALDNTQLKHVEGYFLMPLTDSINITIKSSNNDNYYQWPTVDTIKTTQLIIISDIVDGSMWD